MSGKMNYVLVIVDPAVVACGKEDIDLFGRLQSTSSLGRAELKVCDPNGPTRGVDVGSV